MGVRALTQVNEDGVLLGEWGEGGLEAACMCGVQVLGGGGGGPAGGDGAPPRALLPSGERKRKSGEELRELWRKAILQQILLLRMEKENQKLQGRVWPWPSVSVPCSFWFSFSMRRSRICCKMAFLHSSRSSSPLFLFLSPLGRRALGGAPTIVLLHGGQELEFEEVGNGGGRVEARAQASQGTGVLARRRKPCWFCCCWAPPDRESGEEAEGGQGSRHFRSPLRQCTSIKENFFFGAVERSQSSKNLPNQETQCAVHAETETPTCFLSPLGPVCWWSFCRSSYRRLRLAITSSFSSCSDVALWKT
ncbi:hypothetical protein CRUP_027567 [Coryphaenoides rupestris]|nr:hypothetical protein CRUP_027567 [Coryphaenoides rupestris]